MSSDAKDLPTWSLEDPGSDSLVTVCQQRGELTGIEAAAWRPVSKVCGARIEIQDRDSLLGLAPQVARSRFLDPIGLAPLGARFR